MVQNVCLKQTLMGKGNRRIANKLTNHSCGGLCGGNFFQMLSFWNLDVLFFKIKTGRSSAELQELRYWLARTFCRAHCVQVSLLTVRSAAFPHLPLRRRTVGEAFKCCCCKNTNTGEIKAICSDRETHNVSTEFLLSGHGYRVEGSNNRFRHNFVDSLVTSARHGFKSPEVVHKWVGLS